MSIYIIYGIIVIIFLFLELVYFKIADKANIIDKPNERSSHSSIVLRGGGIIFTLALWIWAVKGWMLDGLGVMDCYPLFLLAVSLAAVVSFVDDVRSLPDSVRLVAQFVAMGLLIAQLFVSGRGDGLFGDSNLLVNGVFVLIALVVCVGATNIYNFMDGINGITGGYSLSVLLPLLLINCSAIGCDSSVQASFVPMSLIVMVILADLVFCFFNFRPKGKAKCFAGDVGSIGIAFILLFLIGRLIISTGDVTYLIFLLVYGVDGCLTIIHRIMLHENLGVAHRKHAYQLMANELKMSHVVVSLLYMGMQLVISLGFIYLCPNTVLAHWVYLIVAGLVLAGVYVVFMKKYYHLHEEYLASLKK